MIQGIQNVSFNGGKETYVNKVGIAIKEAAHDSYAATRRNIDLRKIQKDIAENNERYLNKIISSSQPKAAEKPLENIEVDKELTQFYHHNAVQELPEADVYSAGASFEDRAASYALSHSAVGSKLNTLF